MKIDTSRRFCTCTGDEGLRRLAMMVTGVLASLLLVAAPVRAQEDSHRQEGATIRLVAVAPDADGRVRGALSIELEPGWKTYWIAPGPVGLAPQLDFSGSVGLSGIEAAFPPPIRFAEGDAESIGYAEPVAFPIAAGTAPGAAPVLRVSLFVGICRELCVPVQAVLAARPTSSLSDRALVRRAEAALPQEAAAPPAILRWNADRSALLLDPSRLAQTPTDVFVSAGDGWSFGRPVRQPGDTTDTLSLPVLSRPAPGAALETVDLLLTQAESARLSRAVPIVPR